MATPVDSLLQKLEEVCQCSICLNRLSDPKLLPCLHRFCRDCLEAKLRQRNDNGLFTCPRCQTTMEVPRKAYEHSTDRRMENIINCTGVITTLKNNKASNNCGECSDARSCAAYCFKCSYYICDECQHFHATRDSLKGHRNSILSLRETNGNDLSVDDVERVETHTGLCNHHRNMFQRLVCVSCDEVFICELCATRYHRGHQIEDVTSVAEQFLEQLQDMTRQLSSTKTRMDDIVSKIEFMQSEEGKHELSQKLEMSHQRNVSLIKVGRCLIESEAERKSLEIRNRFKGKRSKIEHMGEAINQEIRKEYQTKITEMRESEREEVVGINTRMENQLNRSRQQESISSQNFQHLGELIDSLKLEEARCTIRLFIVNKDLFKTFDKFMSLSKRMLKGRDDMEIIGCSGTICSGIQNLLFSMNRQIASLESLLLRQTTLYTVPTVELLDYESEDTLEQPGSECNIQVPEPFGVNSDGIIVTTNGSIVLSGHGPCKSYFAIIDVNGVLLQIQPFGSTIISPNRLCTPMKQNEMAMVCPPNEISVWSLHQDKEVISRRMTEVLDLSRHGGVRCVASDSCSNELYVGFFDCRKIYVFDERLQYSRSITLTQCPKWPYDLHVSQSKLLVSDLSGRVAFAVDLNGRPLYRFAKPNGESEEWRPLSLCADGCGLAYILWQNARGTKAVVVQYGGNDGKLIAVRRVTKDACRITTMETTSEKRLLLITQKTRRLQSFSLTTRIDV